MTFDVNEFQRRIIDEFRQNGGKVGGMFEGSALALLTTTGARSGQARTVPLGYLEIDGRAMVVASAMGAPKNPGWYHNVRHDPLVTVEFGTEMYQAMAAVLDGGQEYDDVFAKVVDAAPGYAEYQARTTRRIPVVVLHRIDAAPGAKGMGAKGMGDWLVEVHDWFRKELAELRATVAAGQTPETGFAERCQTFCGGLSRHHTGEDMAVFPALAQQFPALGPALAELTGQHRVVARLNTEIQLLFTAYDPGRDTPGELLAELDRLIAELDAHFRYEEKTVVVALNATAAAPVIPG
ncbi:nitroreductase/quinone reductase family protein [Winogradskya consettensis]|uniref:Hemerythrin n=1 Tax=Winogradskya consettensis TaxID=113560 RepID=A0A919SC23_9ACTN|nr:nitroreductase/quinone reductase family protein [Actinoplanes consettensis]GIM69652.1 hemerythrin [Actinoplanes consettensis]